MTCFRRRTGFTVIEILVVVGIIAVLVGILLPALAGAQKRSRKSTELNYLRQVGYAWSMYAMNYDEAILPGYLEPPVQELWDVSWETPFHNTVPEQDAAPYPWRLMPFLDFNLEVLNFYDDTYELDMTVPAHVTKVAHNPAFGYNAFYIGGWWKEVEVSGNTVAKPAFHDALETGTSTPANPIARRMGDIRRPTATVTFCSSTPVTEGIMKSRDLREGSYLAHAPTVGPYEHWTGFGGESGGTGGLGHAAGSIYEVNAFGRCTVPLGRYTELVAVLYGDGHTASQSASALTDMRMWVPSADVQDFTHTQGSLPHASAVFPQP